MNVKRRQAILASGSTMPQQNLPLRTGFAEFRRPARDRRHADGPAHAAPSDVGSRLGSGLGLTGPSPTMLVPFISWIRSFRPKTAGEPINHLTSFVVKDQGLARGPCPSGERAIQLLGKNRRSCYVFPLGRIVAAAQRQKGKGTACAANRRGGHLAQGLRREKFFI